MELKDLFVSYKQVNPVKFEIKNQNLPTPIYLNKDRAIKVVSEEPENVNTEPEKTQDMSKWVVKYTNSNDKNEKITTPTPTYTPASTSIPTPVSNTNSQDNQNKKVNDLSADFSNFNLSTKLNTEYIDWINAMIKSYKKLGLNDNAIKNLIAQTALESNYGQSKLSGYNNFGGITTGAYWTGKRIKSGDKDKNGNSVMQDFRVYDDMDHFTKDHLDFLTRLYDFDQNDDLNTFLNKLGGNNKGKRKYAQAKDYSKAVTNRYNQIFG